MSDSKKSVEPGQYLSFILNNQSYGVPIGTVREINRVADITAVPQTPSFVAGVMNLRGKVIPVVDQRLKFGLPQAAHTRQTCIIVIESDCGQVGTIVDSVSGVLVLTREQIEPAPVMGNSHDLKFVTGMGKVDNTVLILVDIVDALSKEQLSGIAKAAEGMKLAS
jgi:purine-binding chemotaxis protein CheW